MYTKMMAINTREGAAEGGTGYSTSRLRPPQNSNTITVSPVDCQISGGLPDQWSDHPPPPPHTPMAAVDLGKGGRGGEGGRKRENITVMAQLKPNTSRLLHIFIHAHIRIQTLACSHVGTHARTHARTHAHTHTHRLPMYGYGYAPAMQHTSPGYE